MTFIQRRSNVVCHVGYRVAFTITEASPATTSVDILGNKKIQKLQKKKQEQARTKKQQKE